MPHAHREELKGLADEYGEELPLDRVMLLLAKEEYPEAKMGQYLDQLDLLADRSVVAAKQEEGDLGAAVKRTLFFEEGFRGNGTNYFDPKNSLLTDVLDRRLGIPITLAVVYMEVCRRVGTRAVGIGFPGHFLVQQEVAGEQVLIDPFDRGAIVGQADCERMLRVLTGGGEVPVEPWMFAPASPRRIVSRVLTNLKHAYILSRDYINAVRAIDRLLIISPDKLDERRDRGFLYAELGCARASIEDLEAFLADGEPIEEDTQLIRDLLPTLYRHVAMLN